MCHTLYVNSVSEINDLLAGTGVRLRITVPYRVGRVYGCIAHVTYPSTLSRAFVGLSDTQDGCTEDALTQAVKMLTE